MVSKEDMSKYLLILDELNSLHEEIFTQSELCSYLGISRKKLYSFKNGKSIDFWLLIQYAAIIGKKINFSIS